MARRKQFAEDDSLELPIHDNKELATLAATYLTCNDIIKRYEREQVKLKERIIELLETENTDDVFITDGNGNKFVVVKYMDVKIKLQYTTRVSIAEKDTAVQRVKTNKQLKEFANSLITNVEFIDMDRLGELAENGKISERLLNTLIDKSESEQFSIKRVK